MKKLKAKPEAAAPSAPAVQAEVKKPGPIKKLLQTASLRLKYDEPGQVSTRRGPRTGVSQDADGLEYLARNATPDEIRLFRAAVMARVAKATRVWERCDNRTCGFVFESRADQSGPVRCIKCNYQGREDGGHMVPMTAEAIRAYLEEREKKGMIDRKRMFKASMAVRNEGRARGGLPPLSEDQFRKEQQETFQKMVRLQQAEGSVAELYRPGEGGNDGTPRGD